MHVAVLGEAIIDFIADGEDAWRPHLGGSPFNVALGLARQAIPVSYLPPLSDDAFGNLLDNALRDAGVRLPLGRRSARPTSLALVTVDERGLPTYRLYREGIADKDIDADEIIASLPDDLSVFHTGSLAITPSQLPKVHRVLSHVRERGIPVSVDLNVRLGASADTAAYLDGLRNLLPLCDLVKASDEDLAALSLADSPRAAARAAQQAMGGGVLLLTLGADGAVAVTADGEIASPPVVARRVADTVGAGDTFHAALLAALCRDADLASGVASLSADTLADALHFACTAAAINVERAGCSPPTEAEVRTRLDENARDAT